MATYKFNCSVCNNSITARSKYFKKYLYLYNCENQAELSKCYICKSCKKKRGETIFQLRNKKLILELNENPKFNETKAFINLEALKLKRIGLDNELARNNFLQTVKIILERQDIRQYNFIIENNNLKGVKIKMPFVGYVIMGIDTTKEINE